MRFEGEVEAVAPVLAQREDVRVSVRLSSHAAPSLGPSQVLSRPLLSPRGEGRSAPCSTGTLPNGTGGERPSQQGGQARCGARHAPHLAHARSLAGSMSPAGPPAGGGAAPAGQRGGGSLLSASGPASIQTCRDKARACGDVETWVEGVAACSRPHLPHGGGEEGCGTCRSRAVAGTQRQPEPARRIFKR